MAQILGALKATYNFISGDAITLFATIIAFIVVGVLSIPSLHSPAPLLMIALIAIIVIGLVSTLLREVAGRPRA